MEASVRVVHDLVTGIVPWDDTEEEHRAKTLEWLESTNDVFRRVKPATPARHLVSYVVLIDPRDGSTLLVDHVNAALWLPPGGHVEPGEHPADAARREAQEELGIDAVFADPSGGPSFLTMTRTGGLDPGHTDVSLWFVLVGRRDMDLTIDLKEFKEARWWSRSDVNAARPTSFDPHFFRFAEKVAR